MTPSIDRTLHQFWPLLIWTLLLNLTFYLIVQGFHRTHATGAACQQRTLTPPDTWSCPTLGLACVLMSRPISPELVLSPDFWISNTPRYFSFAWMCGTSWKKLCQCSTVSKSFQKKRRVKLKSVGNFVAKTVLVESANELSLEEVCKTQYSLKYFSKPYRPSDPLKKP